MLLSAIGFGRRVSSYPEFFPTWTTRGGVPLLPSPARDGELLRITLMPEPLFGVSRPALLPLTDRLKRGASLTCSCFGGDDGIGASSRSAWVTLENLIAGGGSSSESLSSIPNRCKAGASAENPLLLCSAATGEVRRMCGRDWCATAAIARFNCFPIQIPFSQQCFADGIRVYPKGGLVANECELGPAVMLLLSSRSRCLSPGPWARSKYTGSIQTRGGDAIATPEPGCRPLDEVAFWTRQALVVAATTDRLVPRNQALASEPTVHTYFLQYVCMYVLYFTLPIEVAISMSFTTSGARILCFIVSCSLGQSTAPVIHVFAIAFIWGIILISSITLIFDNRSSKRSFATFWGKPCKTLHTMATTEW
ncbi:hypothetical protein KC322_g7 [Hortaea werneckii]|nr:hypothetical protein KC322_g7 [Hortaea werneckii]